MEVLNFRNTVIALTDITLETLQTINNIAFYFNVKLRDPGIQNDKTIQPN